MTVKCRVCLYDNPDEETEFCQRCHTKLDYGSFLGWLTASDYPKIYVFDSFKILLNRVILAGAVVSLLICCAGCVPGLILSRVFFPTEVAGTQLVETVEVVQVVTATPLPGPTRTPTPIPTDTPVPTPTPTFTPTSTPTLIPPTAPGTVLLPGERWYGDGISLLLRDPVERGVDHLIIFLEVRNETDAEVSFEMRADMYRMISNIGDVVYLGHTLKKGGILLGPGETLVLSGGGIFKYNFANEDVNQVIIEVIGMSKRLEKAQWKVDIPH